VCDNGVAVESVAVLWIRVGKADRHAHDFNDVGRLKIGKGARWVGAKGAYWVA